MIIRRFASEIQYNDQEVLAVEGEGNYSRAHSPCDRTFTESSRVEKLDCISNPDVNKAFDAFNTSSDSV